MQDIYRLLPEDTQDTYLYRLGSLKERGVIHDTWKELTVLMNEVIRKHQPPWDESSWRKRFRRLQTDPPPIDIIESEEPEEYMEGDDIGNVDEALKHISEMKRERALMSELRSDQNRIMREAASATSLQEILRQEVRRYKPSRAVVKIQPKDPARAIYAMLSDIHYGIAYDNRAGKYNIDIARERLVRYAGSIVKLGETNGIDTVYVSLMGDMISGIIHNSTRLENREDISRQIVGAAEIISEFLEILTNHFGQVYVNAVSGNHSRVDKNLEDSLRGERLDDVVTAFCKFRLEKVDNFVFYENEYDPTIARFDIMGKTYVAVHGDFDADLKQSAARIQDLMAQRIDYLLAGHMHVPEARLEHIGYIRNGSVCGSGDDYSTRKRLYSPPFQICMVVSSEGVDSIHPVRLDREVV